MAEHTGLVPDPLPLTCATRMVIQVIERMGLVLDPKAWTRATPRVTRIIG